MYLEVMQEDHDPRNMASDDNLLNQETKTRTCQHTQDDGEQ